MPRDLKGVPMSIPGRKFCEGRSGCASYAEKGRQKPPLKFAAKQGDAEQTKTSVPKLRIA